MKKEQVTEILNLTRQILPFLMITAVFISLAYRYGHIYSPLKVDSSGDLLRLSCNYLP
jgi:hypothetical protein